MLTNIENYYRKYDQVLELDTEIYTQNTFADPEILDMDEGMLSDWLKTEDGLNLYKDAIENLIRMKPHVYSNKVEEVFGMVYEPIGNVEMTY